MDREAFLLAVNEAFDTDNPTLRAALDSLAVLLVVAKEENTDDIWTLLDKIGSDQNNIAFGILYGEMAREAYFRSVNLCETPEGLRAAEAHQICVDYVSKIATKAID